MRSGIPFTIYCGEVASWPVATVRVPVLATLEPDDCAQWSPQALKPVAV